jgi:hypothetical protein
MKPILLLRAAIVVAGAAVAASGQTVRPESLSYMSRLFRLNDFGILDNPRYSRDGRWLAFDARPSRAGGEHIFVVSAKGGSPIAITTGVQNDTRPMWTAAGDRLVFFSSSGTGAVMTIAIDPATGRAIGPVKRVTIDSLRGAAFDVAPDGRSVAYLTPTGPNKFDLRIVPINGGPANTLASVEGGAEGLRFDRAGNDLYFLVRRLDGAPQKGYPARDVKRIATSGGAPSTVFTIAEGLMGVQIDPNADRVVVRDGDRAHVLTLHGDSVATIAWAQGFHTVSHLGFTPDGSSLVTAIDATRSSIHVVPLDGGPLRVLTDGAGYPWPDYWIGDHIFVSDENHGMQTLLTLDGTKRTISFDLRKANDGVPLRVVNDDPFPDGVHYRVKALDAAGDTSLFVYDSRTGDARRVAQKVTGSRMFSASGAVDEYSEAVGDEILYGNVRNGVAEVHSLDVSGRDRVVQSLALPKQREGIAFGPGRSAHWYQRGDTAYLDVTIGPGKPAHMLARPGAKVGGVVFNADGSSLYADVSTGSGESQRTRGGFFSTVDVRSLALPARWVETGDCWHPTWLPSGAGVLEFCENATGTRTWVSRIPASGPATPQTMTQRETAIFWDYTTSPNGKYVAVPAESNSGIYLWRIDVRATAKGQRGP